jgi:tetratricopeptide (TPR) repeat protein
LARAVAGRELTQALGDCNASLRLAPNDGGTLDNRGLVQFKLGAFTQAIADYDAAIKRDPKDAISLYGRGVAKLKADDMTGGNADVAAAKAVRATSLTSTPITELSSRTPDRARSQPMPQHGPDGRKRKKCPIYWCRLRGLNSRPTVYKTAALPLS